MSVTNSFFILFGDDTNIVYSHSSLESLFKLVKCKTLAGSRLVFALKKLTLNLDRINYSEYTIKISQKLHSCTLTKANKNSEFRVAYNTKVTSAEYRRHNRKLGDTTRS